MNDWFGVGILFLLVLLNGFFVAVEYALVSVRHTRIDQLAEAGSGAARTVQRVLAHLDQYIAAVQLGVSMMSLLIGFIAEPAIEHLSHPLFTAIGVPDAWLTPFSFGLAFILSTTLHIVFGELVPKSAALQRSERFAMLLAPPLVAFTAVFKPVIFVLNAFGRGVLRLFGFQPVAGHHTSYSEEEIRMIVSASSREGVLEEDERELVYNVFDLSDTVVRSVLTPRGDMVVADGSAPIRRLLELSTEHGYSRVPVYQDTPDNIVGVAHTSDVLQHLEELDQMTVAQLMRPTFYVPESMSIKDLLTKMRQRKSHLAIVVDEFGGTSGLVTLEDALEEIVGEIYDETDEEEVSPVVEISEGVYMMDASLTVDQAEAFLGDALEDEEGEFETLAGFVTNHFGDIPEIGAEFVHEGWTFRVEEADERRVSKVLVSKFIESGDEEPSKPEESHESAPKSDASPTQKAASQ
ncbi:HlyC/CorC family transporter [Deinococcus detaillensis]|uniref:HlyC/CorC family transporter n=1 Tax=Deinococcus detaillensis TaxID=2592048 RepID=A0A553UU35_9DEIO|nr:hemolysin family protein [Deinococcus detaillensis]TSA83736.1 HlyC/CorC family transporter [Deinococcus detaillensis]